MRNVRQLLAAAMLSTLMASCASSTMDSVPTAADLDRYEQIVRARMQPDYAGLERLRSRGAISSAEYQEQKNRLDNYVREQVNEAAWNKHYLAESYRKANGIPTPDNEIVLNPGTTQGESFYRPSNQNFGQVTGQSGSAGLGSIRAANEQFGNASTIRDTAISAGGSYLSQPPPGSVYDGPVER
ncbi:MAG: SHOCT domain-containing protein [Prosthecobacter sp.]